MKLSTFKYFTKDMSDESEINFEFFNGRKTVQREPSSMQCVPLGKDKDGKDIYRIVLTRC